MKNLGSIVLIIFFGVFGLVNNIYAYKPWNTGDMTLWFQYSLLGIIGLGIAAIIYILEKNAS